MRVLHQILPPGVKDAEEADLGTKVLRVSGDLKHGFRAGPEQQVVENALVPLTQRCQFMRQSENHVKVACGQ